MSMIQMQRSYQASFAMLPRLQSAETVLSKKFAEISTMIESDAFSIFV